MYIGGDMGTNAVFLDRLRLGWFIQNSLLPARRE
jgi:hypothetical protein